MDNAVIKTWNKDLGEDHCMWGLELFNGWISFMIVRNTLARTTDWNLTIGRLYFQWDGIEE